MIYIAADHNGFQLKKYLVTYIQTQLQKEVEDLGAYEYQKDDDYPDFAFAVAQKIAAEPKSFGILICGSGHGMCIAANKVKGVRAAMGYSIEGAELARRDDDANVLCLAGRILSNDHAAAVVKKFLETEFRTDSDRFTRRLQKISAMEK